MPADDASHTTPDIPRWIARGGAAAWRLLAMALLALLLGVAVKTLTVVVVPIALALLLAGVLEPVVAKLDRDRLPSWVVPLAAVLFVLLVLVATVVGLGVRLADQLPTLREEFSSSLRDVEEQFSIQLPDLPGGADADSSASGGSTSGSSGLSGGRVAQAAEVVKLGSELLFGAFLTLALAFLFLKDGAHLWGWVLSKVRPERRAAVDEAGRAAWGTTGRYVRGLTVVALFDALGIGLGLLVLGVPLVLALAVLQFVASYVPTIGAFVAGAVAAVVAFGTGGITTALFTVALAVAVQQIGNDVIEPWVMGHSLPIHPAVVLIAVGTGAIVWGIAGALLFVPLIAAASAAGHVLWERRHGAEA